MKNIIGLDFSLNCPCLCLHDVSIPWSFSNCQFFYLTNTKKYQRTVGKIQGDPYPLYNSQEERFDKIALWVLSKLIQDDIIYIEGYSYASLGRVNDISECTGVLKNKLFKLQMKFELVPPTVVKKYGSGKGNSSKDKMYESFQKETNFNLLEELNTKVVGNPISDIADSYFICKYGYQKVNV